MKMANLWRKTKPSIFAGWQNLGVPRFDKKKLRIISKGAIPKVLVVKVFHTHLPD